MATLASGFNPVSIAVDATSVYWTNGDTGGGTSPSATVVKVPKLGGMPTTLASGQSSAWAIAVDATSVYWTNQGTGTNNFTDGAIMRVAIAGGPATTLASQQVNPQSIAVDGDNVYWVSGQTLMEMPLSGGGATVLASPQAPINAIALSATSVFFATGAGPSAVMSVPIAGGSPTTLDSDAASITAIAVAGANVYWVATADGASDLYALPFGGGTPAGVANTKDGVIASITLDDAAAYYAVPLNLPGGALPGAFFSVPQTGGGEQGLIESQQMGFPPGSTGTLAVDADSVYYLGGGSVHKLTPK